LLWLLVVAGVVLERDIQNREQAQKAARKSQERLRLALDSANAGSWEWDLRTNRNVWSDEVWKLYGLEPGTCQPSYETWRQAVHPDDRAEAERIVGEAAAAGAELNVEFRVNGPNDSQRWLLARAQPLRNAKGQAEVFVGIALDITHRKQAELEIRQLNSRLEERVSQRTAELETANKELEAFSYSVSHDLRAPLRGIDGWSLALAEDYSDQLDQRALQYLDRVRSETQRMGLLIDDMLQLSRISSSGLRVAPVDLSTVAEGIADRLREANAGRRLVFLIQPGLTAAGDARLLEIALTNLLSNAAKFTGPREEAQVEFGVTQCQSEPVFYVRDNGVGFDMTYAGTLFGAFQRLHKASEFPGTGIGLAIVQRVIHRHRGRVWAEAQRDRGATFFFTIGPSA
jgi:PAS domain S-box-containing protein